MDLNLTGRRALVTGSSSGLGTAIATRLAEEGASIVVHGRDADRTELVAGLLRESGAEVSMAIGDLGTDEGAARVRAAALGDGPIDILVNNAGYYAVGTTWDDVDPSEWIDMYQTNVVGAVRMVKAFVPDMRERGWGRVIQISSVQGATPMPAQPHYAALVAFLASSHAGYITGATIAADGGWYDVPAPSL